MAKFFQLEMNDVKWLGCDRYQKFMLGVGSVTKEKKFGSRKVYYFELMKFNFYIKRIIVCGKFYLPHNIYQLAPGTRFVYSQESSCIVAAPTKLRNENVVLNPAAKFVISKLNLETGVHKHYFLDYQQPSCHITESKQILRKFKVLYTTAFGWGCVAEGANNVRLYSMKFQESLNEISLKFLDELPDKFSQRRVATVGNYFYCFTKYDMVLSIYNAEEKVLTNIKMHSDDDFDALSTGDRIFFHYNKEICAVNDTVNEGDNLLQVYKLNLAKKQWESTKYALPLPSVSSEFDWRVESIGCENMLIFTLQSSSGNDTFIIIQSLNFIPSLLEIVFEKCSLYSGSLSEQSFIEYFNFPPILIRECFGPVWNIVDNEEKEGNKKRKPLLNIFICGC